MKHYKQTFFLDFAILQHNNDWTNLFSLTVILNKLSSILLPQSAVDHNITKNQHKKYNDMEI